MEIEELEGLLRTLVRIPSFAKKDTRLGDFCAGFLTDQGFRVHKQEVPSCAPNILAEKGQAGKALLLYAHLDTVPPSAHWESNPLELVKAGASYLGLGTSDMKAGLALILALAKNLPPLDYRLKIALTVDEEGHSRGAHTLMASDFCQDLSLVLVPELSIDAPYETLGIGRRGLFGFRLSFQSTLGHGALAQAQQSQALLQAAEAALFLAQLPLPTHPEYGAEHLLISQFHSAAEGLSFPENAALDLYYFAHPGRSQNEVDSQLKQALAGQFSEFQFKPLKRPTPASPGYYQNPQDPLIQKIQRLLSPDAPEPLPLTLGLSPADENILAAHLSCPVLSLAPVGGYSHRAQEWVSQSSLRRVYGWYQEILTAFSQWA